MSDYSKTVNLPKTDFPMKAELPKREPEMLARWEKEQVYAKALEKRKDKEKFVLHDGPPYANGHLHLGHALNKILKDIIVRYKTMAGFYAPYVPGWDCHGLPIELQLMKELKVTDKHKVDRTKFREQAAAFAQKFVDIQRQEFKRMGVQGDWEHPYLTMAESYRKAILDTFHRLEKEGYVYRGKKPVYWCATDETALAEAEVEYENDKAPAVFVAFPLHAMPSFNEDDGGHGDEKKVINYWMEGNVSYVIWTTTPWTLPANVAIAMNPDEDYVLFEDNATKRRYILAAKRLEEFQKVCGLTGIIRDTVHGYTFKEASAQHPWIENHIVPILPASFVEMTTGTGLVHIAPGHGMEDYQLGLHHDLEVVSPVDDRGRFTDEAPLWKGEFVLKANPKIIEFLKEKGRLVGQEEIEHSYPHCWRCHKPVIFRATEQWFLNIDHKDLRKRLLAEIERIDKNKGWIPAYGKNRISGMVESRPDWCLSRQRLWGVQISDDVQGKDPDILDVWFDSGVSWAAVLNERPELKFPADMYLEGSDQHRGWFQTSLIPSVALEGKAPYNTVLTHGFVMDGEGRPMSKSLGNVIAPETIISQYGADVLRLWVASVDYGGDVRISQDILKGQADNYRKVRNTFRYLLNNLTDFDPAKNTVAYPDLPEIDRWALHRLQEEVRDANAAYASYQFQKVTSRLVTFCGGDLSSYYLDVVKDRLYCDAADSRSRRAAQTVLYRVADALLRLLAPILSFTADECWRFMGHANAAALEDLPTVDDTAIDTALAERWKHLLTVRESVLQEIEKARAAGLVKAPREVRVRIACPSELKAYEKDLSTIFGVSQVDAQGSGAIEIQKAEGAKCARCWIIKKDIGSNSRFADVCRRCADVLDMQKETVQ